MSKGGGGPLHVCENLYEKISPSPEKKNHCRAYLVYITVCRKSSDTFYIVIYYIKGVTTFWTYSTCYFFLTRYFNVQLASAMFNTSIYPGF